MDYTTHSSMHVAIENSIFNSCGIPIDLVMTEKWKANSDGTMSGPGFDIGCPVMVLEFTPPRTRANGTPLNDGEVIKYIVDFKTRCIIAVSAEGPSEPGCQ